MEMLQKFLVCGMGGGEAMSHIQMVTDVLAVSQYIGLALHTAQTVAQRWTEATAIALWNEQEQMMDIGGMETIFVAMGESRGKYIEN